MDRVLRNKLAIVCFILPAFSAYTVFVFIPMCRSIYFSLFEGTPYKDFLFVGFRNYLKLPADPDFVNSFVVSMKYLVVVAGGWVGLGLAVGLMLAFGMKRFVGVARTIIYLPVVLPGVCVAAMFSKILEIEPYYGLLNSFLAFIGLESLVKPWTGLSSTAIWAICAADTWRGLGYYAVIFYAGIISIPGEFEEAARIDGASTMQIIRLIILPMLRPVTVMASLLAVNNALRVYDMPRVLTQGGPGRSTHTLSIYLFKVAFSEWRYGYGSTVAVVALIVTLMLTQAVAVQERIWRTRL